MKFDIRNGQQLACITCGLCIDACNDIMDKIGKPRGLIGYLALTDETAERAGNPPKSVWRHVFRPRTVLYTVLWAGVGVGLIVALFLRTEIDVNVTPVRNPTFVTLSDGSIRNTYEVRLRNKHGETLPFTISLPPDTPLELTLEGTGTAEVDVPAGSPAAVQERTDVELIVEDRTNDERVSRGPVFHGKGN